MKRICRRILAIMMVTLLLLPDFSEIVKAAVEMDPTTVLSISGTAEEGATLNALMGEETPSGVVFEWFRSGDAEATANGAVIPGATGSSYTLTSEDVGQYIYVEVHGDGITYSAENSCTSAKTAQVAGNTDTQENEQTPESEPAPAPEEEPIPIEEEPVEPETVSMNAVQYNDSASDNTLDWLEDGAVITGASGMGGYATGSILSVLGVTGLSKCTWYRVADKEYPETVEEAEACAISGNQLKYTTTDDDLNHYMFAVYEKSGDSSSPKKQYKTKISDYPIVKYEPALSPTQGEANANHIDASSLAEPSYTNFDPSHPPYKDQLYYEYEIDVRNCETSTKSFDDTEYERRYVSVDLDLPSDMEEGSLVVENRTMSDANLYQYTNVPDDIFASASSTKKITVNIPLEELAGSISYVVGNVKITTAFYLVDKADKPYLATKAQARDFYCRSTGQTRLMACTPETPITTVDFATQLDTRRISLYVVKDGIIQRGYDLQDAYFKQDSTNADEYIDADIVDYNNTIMGTELTIEALQAFPDEKSIILPIKYQYGSEEGIDLEITNIYGSSMSVDTLLFYENVDDIGHPERAVDSTYVSRSDQKLLYVTTAESMYQKGQTFTQAIFDTIVDDYRYLECEVPPINVLSKGCKKVSFQEATEEVPAYITIQIIGNKLFEGDNWTRAAFMNISQSEPDFWFARGEFNVSNVNGAGPMIKYAVPGGSSYMKLTPRAANDTDTDRLSSFAFGTRKQFELKNLDAGETLQSIEAYDLVYGKSLYGSIYGDMLNDVCEITYTEGSNKFFIKFKYPGIRTEICLKTNKGRTFNLTISSVSNIESIGSSDTFRLDDATYFWYFGTDFCENASYRNKVINGFAGIGIQNASGSGWSGSGWSNDANQYISSVTITFQNQVISSNQIDRATGAGEGKVAWFVDDEGKTTNSATLDVETGTKTGAGVYATDKLRYGYNTGVALGYATIKFKNGSNVPKNVRGRTLYQDVAFNVVDEVVWSTRPKEVPDYYTDTELSSLTQEEADQKRQENFKMLQEYYDGQAKVAMEQKRPDVGVLLPNDVTFLAADTDGDGTDDYLKVNGWVDLFSSYASTNDNSFCAQDMKTGIGTSEHAPKIVGSGLLVEESDATETFGAYGICFGDSAKAIEKEYYITGAGDAIINSCYFTAPLAATAGKMIDATTGAREVSFCYFEMPAIDAMMSIDSAYAEDSIFINNYIDLSNGGGQNADKPLFQVTGAATTSGWMEFVVQGNTFEGASGKELHFANCNESNSEFSKFNASGNYYQADTKVQYSADCVARGLESWSKEKFWKNMDAYTDENILMFSKDFTQIDLTNSFRNNKYSKGGGSFKNRNLDKVTGIADNNTYDISIYNLYLENSKQYTLKFTPIDPANAGENYQADQFFTPYGSVYDSKAMSAYKKQLSSVKDYKVLSLSQQGAFPTTTQVSIPVDDGFLGSYYPVFKLVADKLIETGQYASVEDNALTFDVTDGGSYVVASYDGLFNLKMADAKGNTTIEHLSSNLDTETAKEIELVLNGLASGDSALSAEDFENVTVTSSNPDVTAVKSGTKGVVSVSIPRGTFGKATITATYQKGTDTKTKKTATVTINMTAVTFDAATDITKDLRTGMRYCEANAIIKGAVNALVVSAYVPVFDNDGNMQEVQGNESLSIADFKITTIKGGGVKATVSFHINEALALNDALNKLFLKTSAGAFEIPLNITQVVKSDDNLYIVREINGANEAIFIGSANGDRVTVPAQIIVDHNPVSVTAIAAGAMNAGTDGTKAVIGAREIVIGKNVKYIGVNPDTYGIEGEEQPEENYLAPLCDGSGTLGRLEKIYVDPANSIFKGNNPSKTDDDYDNGSDYNLYCEDSSYNFVLCEYPVYSKVKMWTMPSKLYSSAEKDYVGTSRKLECIVVGEYFVDAAYIQEMNKTQIRSYRVAEYSRYGFEEVDGVLYHDDPNVANPGDRLLAYPAEKEADAILLKEGIINIYENALSSTKISTLVIPAGTKQIYADSEAIYGGAFKTNASQIYLYTTEYDETKMDNIINITTAPKNVTIYGDVKYQTWAEGKGYTFKVLGQETNWQAVGKSSLLDCNAGAYAGAQYMYVDIGETIKVGDPVNGIALVDQGAARYSQASLGQVTYHFANTYNDDTNGLRQRSQNIFAEASNVDITDGTVLSVVKPGVKCVEMKVGDTVVKTVYIVARPKKVTVPTTLDVPVEGSTLGDGVLSVDIGQDDEDTKAALMAYFELGLYTTTSQDDHFIPNPSPYSGDVVGMYIMPMPSAKAPVTITTTLLGTSYTTKATVLCIERDQTIALGDDTNGYLKNGMISMEHAGEILLPLTYGPTGTENTFTLTMLSKNISLSGGVKSSNPAVIAIGNEVYQNGGICLNVLKAGTATITVSLLNDPLGRKTTKTIQVVDSPIEGFTVKLNDDTAQLLATATQPAEAVQTISIAKGSTNYIVPADFVPTAIEGATINSADYDIQWTSSDANVLVWNGTDNRFDIKGSGTASLTGTLWNKTTKKADTSGLKVTFIVTIKDYQPAFPITKFSVSKESTEGTRFEAIPTAGTIIDWVKSTIVVSEDESAAVANGLSIEDGTGKIAYIKAEGATKGKGDYFIKLCVKDTVGDTDAEHYEYQKVSIEVTEKVPTDKDIDITVPAVDCFYWSEQQGVITFTMKNGYEIDTDKLIEYVPFPDDKIELVYDGSGEERVYRLNIKEDIATLITDRNFQKTFTFEVPVKGYTKPISKTVTLKYENVAPKVEVIGETKAQIDHVNTPTATIMTGVDEERAFNFSALGIEERYSTISAKNTAAKNLCKEAGVDANGIDPTAFEDYFNFSSETMEESRFNQIKVELGSEYVPSGTYQFTLTTWIEIPAADHKTYYRTLNPVTFDVVVKETRPKTVFSETTLTINRYADGVHAKTILSAGDQQVKFEGAPELELVSKPAKASEGYLDNVLLEYDIDEKDASQMIIRVSPYNGGDGSKLAVPGKYVFNVRGTVIEINGISTGPIKLPATALTVIVADTAPKVSLDTSTVTIDNMYLNESCQMVMSSSGAGDTIDGDLYRVAKDGDPITEFSDTEPEVLFNSNIISVKAKESTQAGTYTYYVQPQVKIKDADHAYPTTNRLKITVKVTSSRPKAKAASASIKLNNQYESAQFASVEYTCDGADITGFIMTPADAKSKNVTGIDWGNRGNHLMVRTGVNTPTGTYTYQVTPKADMTIRDVLYTGVSLAPIKLTVTVVSAKPTLKLKTATATLYPQYGAATVLPMLDVAEAIKVDATAPHTFYLNKVGKLYKVENEQGTECYAKLVSTEDGSIEVSPESASQFLSKDLTVKNVIINRELEIKQFGGGSIPLTDMQTINVVFKASAKPTATIDKTALTFNTYFDLTPENMEAPENIITVGTTASSPDGTTGAYITKYELTMSGAKNNIQAVPAGEFTGTKSTLSLMVIPMMANGTTTVTVTPYVSNVPFDSPAYNPGALTKLNPVKFTVKFSNNKPVVNYSKKTLTLNERMPQDQTIDMKPTFESIAFAEITLKSMPKGATDGMVDMWEGTDDNGFEQLIARVNDTTAPTGNYVFNVTPVVQCSDGSMLNLATQAITVKVTNTLPKVAFQSAAVKINTTTNTAPAPSTMAKVVFSGEFADQIKDCYYDFIPTTKPKTAWEGAVRLKMDEGELWDRVIVECADRNVPAGIYKFDVVPYPQGDNVNYDGMKKISLSVTVTNSNPKASLAKTATTLNAYYGQQDDTNYLKLPLEYEVEDSATGIKLVSYPSGKDGANTREAVDVYTETNHGRTYVKAWSSTEALPGTYKFEITPVIKMGADDLIELNKVTYSVKVANVLPKVKLASQTLALHTDYAMDEATSVVDIMDTAYGICRVDSEESYETVKLTGKPKTASQDMTDLLKQSIILKTVQSGEHLLEAGMNGNAIPAGSYNFTMVPVVYTNAGVRLELAQQKFTVKVDDKPLSISLKAKGGKLDVTDRAGTALIYQPVISNQNFDKVLCKEEKIKIIPAASGVDYSRYFKVTDQSEGTIGIALKTDTEAGTTIKPGTYAVRLRFETENGIFIETPLSIKVGQATGKVTATPTKAVLYKSAADIDAPAVMVTRPKTIAEPIVEFRSQNENFNLMTGMNSNGTEALGFQIRFAGDPDGETDEQLQAAQSRAAYQANKKIQVPVDIVLQSGTVITKAITIEVTVQN